MKILFQDVKINVSKGSTTCAIIQKRYMEKKLKNTCDICNIIPYEYIAEKCQFTD
jgi:hypothetical protein